MRTSLIIGVVVAILLGLMGSVYVVREGQTGMVLNLGRVARSDIGPGLHFKWPLVESAQVFDLRFQVTLGTLTLEGRRAQGTKQDSRVRCGHDRFRPPRIRRGDSQAP